MRLPGRLATTMHAKLRPDKYLFLLDQAALTGFIPKLDFYGNPIVDDRPDYLDPAERLKVLKFLIDKVLPSPKAQDPPPPIDVDALVQDPTEVRKLSTAQLVEVARRNQEFRDATDTDPELQSPDA